MAENPPCISGLVGCDDDGINWLDRPLDMSEGTSSRRSFGSSKSSSSSSVTFGNTSSNSGFNSGSETYRLSRYTVALTNREAILKTGIRVTHGPLPSGFSFDPDRSTPGCRSLGSSVECTTDLPAGQQKELVLVYRMPLSSSCAIALRLQEVITNPSQGIAASVSCFLEQGNVTTSASASSSSFSSSSSSSSSSSISPSFSAAGFLSSSSAQSYFPAATIKPNDSKTGVDGKIGYDAGLKGTELKGYDSGLKGSELKGYDPALKGKGKGKGVVPKSGVTAQLFQKAVPDYVMKKHTPQDSGLISTTFLTLLILGLTVGIVLMVRRFRLS